MQKSLYKCKIWRTIKNCSGQSKLYLFSKNILTEMYWTQCWAFRYNHRMWLKWSLKVVSGLAHCILKELLVPALCCCCCCWLFKNKQTWTKKTKPSCPQLDSQSQQTTWRATLHCSGGLIRGFAVPTAERAQTVLDFHSAGSVLWSFFVDRTAPPWKWIF